MSNDDLSLTVLILTYNEERHLARAIESVSVLSAKILIIDSYSTDRTEEIAIRYGATILKNIFTTQSQQLRWALSNASIQTKWIFRLDADEVIYPDLATKIIKTLPHVPEDVIGVCLNRKQFFLGRWIRHGGRYPLWLLRIWRNGSGAIENRWMDEHVVIRDGKTVKFDGGFADINLSDLSSFIEKHNKYATREAVDRLGAELSLFLDTNTLDRPSGNSQALLKRMIKNKIYNKIPFGLAPFAYFFFRYFLQLGFLDGRQGAVYHFLQGLWYRFLVEAKLFDLRHSVSHLKDPEAIKAELRRLTGLHVN